jgi:hypothetical protein
MDFQTNRKRFASNPACRLGRFPLLIGDPHSMKLLTRFLTAFAVLSIAFVSAPAQVYKLHSADVAVGGTGQFTTSITSQNNLPHQSTTESAGFLFSLHDAPVAWAGIELNYQYSSFSERYVSSTNQPLVNIPISFHEATAAYVFHPHFRHLQPFVNVGGGAIYFDSTAQTVYQWRGTGLVETGFDIPTANKHIGFRIEGRGLFYRAPNFHTPAIASSRWVATEEPSASVYYRF